MKPSIEAAGKILGWSFTFGVRSVENCFKKGTLKNLMTPNLQFQLHVTYVQNLARFLLEVMAKLPFTLRPQF